MQIKQLVLVIILILSLISFLAPSLFAAEVKTESLDSGNSDNPGILQTNPFYFVKEWGRGIQRVFTFSPLAKLQYDFQVATDKSVELERLEEIGVVGELSLRGALLNYADSLKSLSSRLQALNAASDVTNGFISGVTKQKQMLEELESRHISLKTDFEATSAYLDQILQASPF